MNVFEISMIVVALLSAVLLWAASGIDKAMTPADANVRAPWEGLLVLGVVGVVAALGFLAFMVFGCSCTGGPARDQVTLMMVCGFFLVLGIVLTSLSAVIRSRASGNDEIRSKAGTTMGLGIAMIVGTAAMFAYGYYIQGKFGEKTGLRGGLVE